MTKEKLESNTSSRTSKKATLVLAYLKKLLWFQLRPKAPISDSESTTLA